jgi:hypothetical protein
MADNSQKENKYDFDNIKTEYEDKVGKTDSMYVVVIYKCNVDELLEFTKNKMQNAMKIKDSHRRGRAKTAYYNIRQFAEEYPEDHIFNNLIMMDVENDAYDVFSLNQSTITLLNSYDCDNIWYRCTDHYDLNELYDYLESDKYYHMFRVKNNKVRYIKLGKTKKIVADTHESKSLDLIEYINNKIPQDARFLAYGVSSKLSQLSKDDPKAYDVLNYDVSDSSAIDFIQKMDQSDILDVFETDLQLMNDMKTLHRVIFKKDFKSDKIAILQKIYIDKRILDKFLENCKNKEIEISFEIVVIDHRIKDFNEGRELRILEEFGGVVGVTYY